MSEDKRKRSPNWLSCEKELQQIIADQYNSRTSHCLRTSENLKAQWESMKKVARKDAANNRRQTGGGSPKKIDPFLQRILRLISTSAVVLCNPNACDTINPAVQDETAIPSVKAEDFPEPPPTEYKG